jgi:general secretion pathway protein D
LLGSTRGGPTTFVEGTGRFVGEPATGAIRASGEAVGDGVTLNLVNVPAPQAAKIVLGDMLSVKYTVDPGIEGKITIQTPKPVTRTAAIDLFQAALRSNNAALVDTDGTYRIVPIDQANIGAGIRVEGEPQGERIGSGLQVVSLKYVTAAEIRRVLEPIAPKGGIVRTHDPAATTPNAPGSILNWELLGEAHRVALSILQRQSAVPLPGWRTASRRPSTTRSVVSPL